MLGQNAGIDKQGLSYPSYLEYLALLSSIRSSLIICEHLHRRAPAILSLVQISSLDHYRRIHFIESIHHHLPSVKEILFMVFVCFSCNSNFFRQLGLIHVSPFVGRKALHLAMGSGFPNLDYCKGC